jgi:hypothetical protein
MAVVALVFGFFLAFLLAEYLRREEYEILSLFCYFAGIFYALYMVRFL